MCASEEASLWGWPRLLGQPTSWFPAGVLSPSPSDVLLCAMAAAAAELDCMATAAELDCVATAAASLPVPLGPDTSPPRGLLPHPSPRPSDEISLDSEALRSQAERREIESEACVIDTALLPTLESLLQDMYTSLLPQPVDYDHRRAMIRLFNTIVGEIFGKENGLPIVEAFGSFTMDLFTPKSDLDLSVNFNTDTNFEYPRLDRISTIRSLAKALRSHLRRRQFHGIAPIVSARVPVLKAIEQRTSVECDISVENKDGMSRSIIFKFISSIDERFKILCYLIKFWAKVHDVNSPKDRTMSSMAIISLVAFHLQTRRPPILPAFSAILKDGMDFASIEKNVSPFKEFGHSNKESIAELFVSLMSKLASVEGLWEQGLCVSNLEGSWISKTWEKGVGSLSVEDFLDPSQNFARAVGVEEMKKICECLRATVSDLGKFFMGEIDAPKLKALLFEPVNPVKPESVDKPRQETAKRKRVNPNKTSTKPSMRNDKKKKPLEQDKPADSPGEKGTGKKSNSSLGNSHAQQKKAKAAVPSTGRTGKATVANRRPPIVPIHPQGMCWPVPMAHVPHHVIAPPAFGYGLPPPPLLPVHHHPEADFLHINPGMQLHHQRPMGILGPPPGHHLPVLHEFHPYGVNGAHQMQRFDNRRMQRPPYGMGLGFWR